MNTTKIENDAKAVNPLYAEIQHAGGRLKAAVSELDYERHKTTILKGIKFKDTPVNQYPAVLVAFRLALATHLTKTFGPIFPLEAELKSPWSPNGHLDATTDPAQLERWVRAKPNCNWGGCCNSVVDVDTSAAHGKDGLGNWKALLQEFNGGAEPNTLRLKTPTGGLHYPLTTKYPKRDLRPGVELPNYIVMPGSHVTANGKSVKVTGFYKPDNNEPIKGVSFIGKLIAEKVEKVANDNAEPASDIDSDAAIAQATAMLKDFAASEVMRDDTGAQYNGPAIQGEYGDNWTVLVAMRVGDCGVSCETCLDLMDEHFNNKCVPPWSFEGNQSLRTKVESAYKSRQSKIGAGSAEAEFGKDPIPETVVEMKDRLKRTEERRTRKEQQAAPENWDSLQNGWCHIGQQRRYVRKRDGMLWETAAFSDFFANVDFPDKGTNTTAHKWVMQRPQGVFQKFDTFCYLPGRGESVNGAYNQYVPSVILSLEGDTKLWDQHLEYLFPDPAVRKIVLDWLAWVIQNLDKKPKHALFILGQTQGTGKSFIGDVFSALVGEHNRTPVDQATFETPHNGWQMRTKIVTCEEIRSLSSQAMRKLHGWITQTHLHVNEKNMPQVTIDDLIAYLFFSNKLDAIALDDSDRRYAVAETNVKPKDKDYYCRLYDLLDDPRALAAIKHQLMTRPLDGYTAAGAAPLTDAKLAMIEEGATDLQTWMVSQQAKPPFSYKLVTVNEVVETIPRQYHPRGGKLISPVRDVLRRRYGGIPLDKVGPIQTGASKRDTNRVWAIGPEAAATAKLPWSTLSAIYRAEHKIEKAAADNEAAADFEE